VIKNFNRTAALVRMDSDKALNYEEVKKLLFYEFHLSPAALLEKFNSLQPKADETYTLYGNRLMSVLAKTHEQLMQLLVCDRIKSIPSRAALQHVLSLENKADDGWLKLSALLEALDMCYDTHLTSDKPRTVQSAISKVTGNTTESVQANFSQTKRESRGKFSAGKTVLPIG